MKPERLREEDLWQTGMKEAEETLVWVCCIYFMLINQSLERVFLLDICLGISEGKLSQGDAEPQLASTRHYRVGVPYCTHTKIKNQILPLYLHR